MRIFMSVNFVKELGHWQWLGISPAGGIKQGGFPTKEAATAAGKAQQFKPGVVQVWNDEMEVQS